MSFNPCRDNGNCSPVLAHKIDLKAINEMAKLSLKHQNDTYKDKKGFFFFLIKHISNIHLKQDSFSLC